jgi:hypothetical protein
VVVHAHKSAQEGVRPVLQNALGPDPVAAAADVEAENGVLMLFLKCCFYLLVNL